MCAQALDCVAGLGLLQPPMRGALIPPPPPAAPAPAPAPTSHHIVQEVRKSWPLVACHQHGSPKEKPIMLATGMNHGTSSAVHLDSSCQAG